MRSSDAERARRVNATINWLKTKTSDEVLAGIIARYGLSRRQAYRYLQEAQRASAPLPIPSKKAVFTVKLPQELIFGVRRHARGKGCSISLWVEQALRSALEPLRRHG